MKARFRPVWLDKPRGRTMSPAPSTVLLRRNVLVSLYLGVILLVDAEYEMTAPYYHYQKGDAREYSSQYEREQI